MVTDIFVGATTILFSLAAWACTQRTRQRDNTQPQPVAAVIMGAAATIGWLLVFGLIK